MDQIVIIGGGSSISEGIQKGLWGKIQDHWTLGCNSTFRFFTPTALIFVDFHQFYELFHKDLINLPLIIGRYGEGAKKIKHKNTILLKEWDTYDRFLKDGVYCGMLCGLFAASLATFFLEDGGDIFLLGFDFGANGVAEDGKARTHFYQGELNHPGVGHTSLYAKERRITYFNAYRDLEGINVYNVSLLSKLTQFPLISYDTFFEKLNSPIQQNSTRNFMVKKLKTLTHYYYESIGTPDEL